MVTSITIDIFLFHGYLFENIFIKYLTTMADFFNSNSGNFDLCSSSGTGTTDELKSDEMQKSYNDGTTES